MYKQEKGVWEKHIDFILLDIICMHTAYIFAYVIRHGWNIGYFLEQYLGLEVILFLTQICVGFFVNNYRDILRRGYFEEFKKTALYISINLMVVFVILFMNQSSDEFSRITLMWLWGLGILFLYIERVVWKEVIRKKMRDHEQLNHMILVTREEHAEEVIRIMQKREYSGYEISGILIEGRLSKSDTIFGIPVLGSAEDADDILKKVVVDEVFLDLPVYGKRTKEIQRYCREMGITTHLNLGPIDDENENMIVDNYAEHMVLTSSIRFADSRQLLLKRIMDIAGGIVGLCVTVVITIIFGPVIYIQSPGSIFFSQERIGRNGRRFKIYKFRSMYPDAEERKKELMAQNKMQGLMFKMDNDPRIIPIGHFMRKTSLDEFPQFWNVLKGDMSLVGTRPPTVDEYEQYEMHHKARLAVKPGLTGMWQISGRSDIVDFEEVVRLDTKYIENWNIALDLRILLKTVLVLIKREGSM